MNGGIQHDPQKPPAATQGTSPAPGADLSALASPQNEFAGAIDKIVGELPQPQHTRESTRERFGAFSVGDVRVSFEGKTA